MIVERSYRCITYGVWLFNFELVESKAMYENSASTVVVKYGNMSRAAGVVAGLDTSSPTFYG